MKIPKLPFYALWTLLLSFACQSEEEGDKGAILRPVRYQVVGNNTALNKQDYNGVAIASQETELSFRTSGVIVEYNVKVGKSVKKGDLVARLDNIQAQLAYEQTVSALSSAQSAMNIARSSLNRTKILYEKGSASLSDYEAAKNSFQSASDQYESAVRNKGIKQSQIEYGKIYAPNDGIYATSGSGINENASAGQVIAVINSGKGINVELGVPESLVNLLELGMKAQVAFSALGPQRLHAEVIKIAPAVDENASTFPVELKVIEPNESIKPGMIANVTFSFDKAENSKDVLIVPVKAVGEDAGGNFVFLIQPSDSLPDVGKVKKQYVDLGELTNEGFNVLDGLKKGERIATAGLQTLLDGQDVSLK